MGIVHVCVCVGGCEGYLFFVDSSSFLNVVSCFRHFCTTDYSEFSFKYKQTKHNFAIYIYIYKRNS